MIFGRNSQFARTSSRWLAAFSLIEVLIAVTLMSVIVLGLMAMFGETQRAFRTGINQVDIMEGGRSAMDLMAREMEQAVPTEQFGAKNFSVGQNPYVGFGTIEFPYSPGGMRPYALLQELPGTPFLRTNFLQDVVFMTRAGQEWTAIGYAVVYSNYLGTLYRFETNYSAVSPDWQFAANAAQRGFFQVNPNAAGASQLLENVVDFRFRTYDSLGRLLSPAWNFKTIPKELIGYPRTSVFRGDGDFRVEFYSNAIPAYVEIELAVLDPKVAGRARTLGEDSLNSQRLYLEKQAGSVQVFRRRVPIRNVDPSVYQ